MNAVLIALVSLTQTTPAPMDVPAWLFPRPASAGQVSNMFGVADWHPDAHPPMPDVVAHGRRPAVRACAYCHLPEGIGRPENAMLAGLPVAYIEQQVRDMKSGARHSAWRGPYLPSDYMRGVADSATEAEIEAAARYFSQLPARQRARVIEATEIPRVEPAMGLYMRSPSGDKEPLGQRLIEMPNDASRHELHDPRVVYTAYVPPGSVARGHALATAVCESCHGPGLHGVAPVPPLAGRSPSYLLRQLVAFQIGARSTPVSAPMRTVVATLTLNDMIAAAAYAASLSP